MNAVETDTPGVVKIEYAIGAATQRLADAEAGLEQLRARRRRALVADDQTDQRQLHEKRKKALAKGDEGEVSRLDAEIGKAIDLLDADIAYAEKVIVREKDRLQVLNDDLAQAKAHEHERKMDALFNRADAARKIGEALIRNEYAQLSTKMVDVLTKLIAVNMFIRDANAELEGTSSRPGDKHTRRVAAPNNIRRTADRIIPATTREVEYQVRTGGQPGLYTDYQTRTRIEDVPEEKISGSWQSELPNSCEIAPAMEGGVSWSNKFGAEHGKVAKRYQEIVDALL